jgi:antitoxin component YwqK of YwqJK toxin-antitoxin module
LYFKNGKLISKGSYLNDYLHYSIINDKTVIVNKNNVLAETIYSSKIISSFLLSNDVLYLKHGLWLNFDDKGIITDEIYYFKGEKISKFKYTRLTKKNKI